MERPRKSKGVSWAKGNKLHQVKYFSPDDDCLSQIGRKSQGGHHHLQAKPSSSILHSSTSDDESNDPDLPPGFENGPFLIQSKVKWKCPPQIVISPDWLVAAGEASEEKDTQKLRELTVVEAHYPSPCYIPPSPYVSADVEEEDYDDTATPLVPLIPTEGLDDDNASPIEVQEDVAMEISPERAVANAPSNVQSQNLAAVIALVEAILKMSTEHGSIFDLDLLIKILKDALMVERLSTEIRTPPTNLSASSSNNPLSISTSGLNPAFPIPPMPLSTSPLTGSVVKPSAPSFTVLNPAPNNLITTQFAAPISSYSMANSTHAATSAPLSWPVCAPHTADPQIQLSRPAYSPFKPADTVQAASLSSSSSSGMKRAASFSISPKEQSYVQFSSTTEKYLNAFGTARTTTTTLPAASQSNTGSSRSDASAGDDVEFYRNLVRQRDEAKLKQEPERYRSQIPACIYYNSPRGYCRNGDKCRFRHDVSSQREADNNVRGTSYAKKLRL